MKKKKMKAEDFQERDLLEAEEPRISALKAEEKNFKKKNNVKAIKNTM